MQRSEQLSLVASPHKYTLKMPRHLISDGRVVAHLVRGIVNVGGGPLALVGRVGDLRPLPLAAAWALRALGVGDLGGLPLTILLLVPVFWLARICTQILYSRITSCAHALYSAHRCCTRCSVIESLLCQ